MEQDRTGRNLVEQLMGFPFKISLSFDYYVRARVLWLHVHTYSRPSIYYVCQNPCMRRREDILLLFK